MRQAQRTPAPLLALGVRAEAMDDEEEPSLNLEQLEHAWMAGRPARLAEALQAMADDPRRRFVMGRERYEEDVREKVQAAQRVERALRPV